MASEEHAAEMFVNFVDTFSPESRPDILSISGGEALLRPGLVRQLAERAREVGTRSTVLSGLFFATCAQIPPSIHAAIRSVDHFSASIDVFHERQIPRADVFRVFDTLLGEGVDLSLHIAGHSADDPYLEDIVADVRETFADRIPMLVNRFSAFGRARTWLTRKLRKPPAAIEVNPCPMAAWPVVSFDGTVIACANDDAHHRLPPHLRLGHAAIDSWATIRARSLESPMLRAIRVYGPEHVAARFGATPSCAGYCETCMKLPEVPSLDGRVAELMRKPTTTIVEREAARMIREAGALAFVRQQGVGRFTELITLGAET